MSTLPSPARRGTGQRHIQTGAADFRALTSSRTGCVLIGSISRVGHGMSEGAGTTSSTDGTWPSAREPSPSSSSGSTETASGEAAGRHGAAGARTPDRRERWGAWVGRHRRNRGRRARCRRSGGRRTIGRGGARLCGLMSARVGCPLRCRGSHAGGSLHERPPTASGQLHARGHHNQGCARHREQDHSPAGPVLTVASPALLHGSFGGHVRSVLRWVLEEGGHTDPCQLVQERGVADHEGDDRRRGGQVTSQHVGTGSS